MTTISLTYASQTKAYDCFWTRGLEDVDDMVNRCWDATGPDGAHAQLVFSTRRRITLKVFPVAAKADRVWMVGWILASDRAVISSVGETVRVALDEPTEFAGEWLNACELARAFTIVAVEATAMVAVPPSLHTWLPKLDPSGAIITDPSGQPVLVMVD